MSKPYSEVVLLDKRVLNSDNMKFSLTSSTPINIKSNSLYILWQGSLNEFINDFDLPTDSVLGTKVANITNLDNVKNWLATLNFKFNYEVWFKDPANSYYVLGSNNTVYLTFPNFILFGGGKNFESPFYYDGNSNRLYNPNIFPLDISVSSFVVSNKSNDFQTISGYGTNSQCYLIFRYGISGKDIQICLQTKDSGAFQVNSSTLIIPYASLTFSGFNKIKKVNRV